MIFGRSANTAYAHPPLKRPSRLSHSGLEDKTYSRVMVDSGKPKLSVSATPLSPCVLPPMDKTTQINFRGRARLGTPGVHHVPNARTSSPRGGEPLQ